MSESKTEAARQDKNVLLPTDQLDYDSQASYCRPSQFKRTDANRAALGSDSLDESGSKSMSTGFGVDMTEFTERSNPDSGIGVDSAHTSRAPYSRETWENEVLEFQKAKKQAVTSSNGYDTWRQRLRRRLQAELEQRVRKAVQTPPLERLHRRSQTRQEQATEAQTAQRQHKRQLVTKMNEMVGGTRSVHLVDGPPKPMFCNTVDLRLHPETHQWRKRWHRNSPPTIRQVEHLNGLILSSEDEIQNETRPRWTQQSLNRWLHRSRINNCDTASDTAECSAKPSDTFNITSFRGRTGQNTFRQYQSEDTEDTSMSRYRNDWSPEEEQTLDNDLAKSCSSLKSHPKPRFSSTRKPFVRQYAKLFAGNVCPCNYSQSDDIGCEHDLYGCPWKAARLDRKVDWFSFDWDVDVEKMGFNEDQRAGCGQYITHEDEKILKELKKFPVNTVHAKRRWVTRQDVLQRLPRLTPMETQMFHFSATRTAFLVASLHKQHKLPDGSAMTQTTLEQSLISEVYFGRAQLTKSQDQESFTEYVQQNPTEFARLQESSRGKPSHVIYEDWCGVVRDHHGPFWPPGIGPFYPPPQHIYPEMQPLSRVSRSTKHNENNSSLLAISKQAARFRSHKCMQFQEPTSKAVWGEARVVFDSECSPRWTAAMLEAIAASSQLVTSIINPGWIPPTLAFESRFESGNLREARRIGPFEYELILKPDQYTKRHVQWFYFAVCNASPDYVYRFVITNFTKRTSLYSKGMKILRYSEHDAATKKIGWQHVGENISYTKNVAFTSNRLLLSDATYYQLQWEMTFPNADDLYYLSYCYPYTYTDLKADLDDILHKAEENSLPKGSVNCEVLCQTRAGNSCFSLFVTDPSIPVADKYALIISARVHPGESNSSWMMLGLMQQLISLDPDAQELRKRFFICLVPMLNPDGVIVGNYRCSLSGRDMNRNYRRPRKEVFPTVWHIRKLVQSCKNACQDVIYCDLHGHSRQNNVFMYGCDPTYDQSRSTGLPQRGNYETSLYCLRERLLPYLLAQQVPESFSLPSCRFSIHPSKEATGRVVFWREFNLTHSFTLEATFNGSRKMRDTLKHFDVNDFALIGRRLGSTLLILRNILADPKALKNALHRLGRELICSLLKAFETEQGTPQSAGSHLGATKSDTSGGVDGRGRGERLSSQTIPSQTELILESSIHTEQLKQDNLTKSSISQESAILEENLNKIMNMMVNNDVPLEDTFESVTWLENMTRTSGECGRKLRRDLIDYEDDDGVTSSCSDSNSGSEHELSVGEQRQLALTVDHTRGVQLLRNPRTDLKSMDPVRVIDQRKPRPHRKSKKVKRGTHKPVSDPKVSEEPQKEVNKITIKVPKEQFISNKDGNTHASEDTNKVNHQHHRKIQPRPKFVSKYADLTNHGIPCFVEKRLLERACQLEAQLRMEENGADELDRQFLQHLRHIQTETYHYEQFLEQQQTSDRDEPTIEIGRSGTISTMKSRMNTTSNHRFPPLSSYNHLSTPIGFNRLRNYGTTPSNQSQANMFYPIQAQALSCLLHARNEPEQGAPVVIRRVKTFSNCKQYERS